MTIEEYAVEQDAAIGLMLEAMRGIVHAVAAAAKEKSCGVCRRFDRVKT
ncbi:MAG: hypothetical protein LBC35_03260 [Coriobacteriales bacterium]|jgi:hypothetical protein|nr:hypothetical protein [Coriobacteriales bacterium]